MKRKIFILTLVFAGILLLASCSLIPGLSTAKPPATTNTVTPNLIDRISALEVQFQGINEQFTKSQSAISELQAKVEMQQKEIEDLKNKLNK